MRSEFCADREWLARQFEALSTEMVSLTPSQWAEQHRYLPPSATSMPGHYRYSVSPYLREIVDCLGVDSPVREVAVQKGVQIGATVGVLENIIGYAIEAVKTAPVMMITADAELAKLRMESYITPMLQYSGLDSLIKSADEKNPSKRGKALDISTPIPTPSGFRLMGELEVGDWVYAADGTAVQIDCISDVHERECFEVVFANGETIVASDDHRWSVKTRDCRQAERKIYTTAKMALRRPRRNSGYAFRVDTARPVVGTYRQLAIAPYTLGAWLGDGSSRTNVLSVGDAGRDILKHVEADGYEIHQWTTTPGKCPAFGIRVPGESGKGSDCFYALLRRLGLINNKHIPSDYLTASVEQRMELLRGLMDTDGTCAKHGACQITQKNERLAREIWSLANSLGFKASIRSKTAICQTGASSNVHVVEFYADASRPVFKLDYKKARLKAALADRSRLNTVESVSPVGKRFVKCIGVVHPSHLFLCGRGYVPTHNTDKKIEWVGGGFLIPFGAQNANKLRSISIQVLLRDEIDGWPDVVGKDGDPIKLSADRTAAYESSRKILDISTPLIKGQSKIAKRFLAGDQRYYFVCCLACGFPQVLRWRETAADGTVSGIVWETDGGRLVSDSVRYLCVNCQHAHTNDDKTRLLSPDNGAEWRPTATPSGPHIRSYHLSALYSPVGMQTWEACVHKWLEAWDDENGRPRDMGQLQVFYNNVLGEPFELRGEKLRYEQVSSHRRLWYSSEQVPNKSCERFCGSPVLLLTCQVDVHADNLAVAVLGWCRDKRSVLVEYSRFEGPTDQLDCAATWGRLRQLIESKEYVADDGKRYRVMLTLIDSGYRSDEVYTFCADYEGGVYPVKGRDASQKSTSLHHFSSFTTSLNTSGFGITVDPYKDRWSATLRRSWDEAQGIQPEGHFNAPVNIDDKQLKELTVEVKRERIEKSTGKRIGYEWHRPSGANNELWDLLVYGSAALDMLAVNVCEQLGYELINWYAFWDYCVQEKPYYSE